MLSRCYNLTTLPLPFPLSFVSLDTHGNGIAESSWLTDYYNSCRYRLCDDLDASAMFAGFVLPLSKCLVHWDPKFDRMSRDEGLSLWIVSLSWAKLGHPCRV